MSYAGSAPRRAAGCTRAERPGRLRPEPGGAGAKRGEPFAGVGRPAAGERGAPRSQHRLLMQRGSGGRVLARFEREVVGARGISGPHRHARAPEQRPDQCRLTQRRALGAVPQRRVVLARGCQCRRETLVSGQPSRLGRRADHVHAQHGIGEPEPSRTELHDPREGGRDDPIRVASRDRAQRRDRSLPAQREREQVVRIRAARHRADRVRRDRGNLRQRVGQAPHTGTLFGTQRRQHLGDGTRIMPACGRDGRAHMRRRF